ncbi:MAG: hypothetical protein LBK42_13215 [Propionibacteriaceae bacterium]|nr:hypothetical protein [Propionibacteriaceae bacterium]
MERDDPWSDIGVFGLDAECPGDGVLVVGVNNAMGDLEVGVAEHFGINSTGTLVDDDDLFAEGANFSKLQQAYQRVMRQMRVGR